MTMVFVLNKTENNRKPRQEGPQKTQKFCECKIIFFLVASPPAPPYTVTAAMLCSAKGMLGGEEGQSVALIIQLMVLWKLMTFQISPVRAEKEAGSGRKVLLVVIWLQRILCFPGWQSGSLHRH